MKNYYNILGIPSNATLKQVNDAYKKLALKFHPDKNSNDAYFANWFKEINEAKQVLSDTEKRIPYDDTLEAYTNAHELLEMQQKDDLHLRSTQRNWYLQTRTQKQKWWIAVAAVLFLVCSLIIIQDNDSKPIGGEFHADVFTAQKMENAIVPTEAIPATPAIINTNRQVEKPEVTTESKAVEELDLTQNEVEKVQPSVEVEAERALTENELAKIAAEVKQLNSSYCVQVIQTQNSNIKKDFAIAQYLASKGFTIAGRSIKNIDVNGFEVLLTDNCMQLIVGVLSNTSN